MTMEDKRKIGIACEICNEDGATEIKGGGYKEERKMWMVCKKCKDLIEDNRRKHGEAAEVIELRND